MRRTHQILLPLVICLFLMACGGSKGPPVDNPYTPVDESIVPDKGQPAFPKLDQYWVVDSSHCFRETTIQMADQVFEKLRTDRIAEVAVLCVRGVKNQGPLNDEKIWAMKWGRWAKLGDKQDRRAIVWLIRPDVRPEENRITVEVSTQLYWWTAIDYGPGLEEAADYANVGDLNGALESITRTTDETLRYLWRDRGGQQQ